MEDNSFDKKAADFDDMFFSKENTRSVVESLGGVLSNMKEVEILDWGCGTGMLLQKLTQNYPQISSVVGIDVSEKMIEQCNLKRERDPQFSSKSTFFNLNLSSPGLLSGRTFSLIITVNALHHIPNPKEQIAIFKSYLKPGGTLVLYDFVANQNTKTFMEEVHKRYCSHGHHHQHGKEGHEHQHGKEGHEHHGKEGHEHHGKEGHEHHGKEGHEHQHGKEGHEHQHDQQHEKEVHEHQHGKEGHEHRHSHGHQHQHDQKHEHQHGHDQKHEHSPGHEQAHPHHYFEGFSEAALKDYLLSCGLSAVSVSIPHNVKWDNEGKLFVNAIMAKANNAY